MVAEAMNGDVVELVDTVDGGDGNLPPMPPAGSTPAVSTEFVDWRRQFTALLANTFGMSASMLSPGPRLRGRDEGHL